MMNANIPPRPCYDSPECKLHAVDAILGDVVVWLEQNGMPGMSTDSVRHYLLHAFDDDGYQFARNLERKSISPDAELVELLNNASRYSAHNALVRAWVKQNDVRVPFVAGDRVTTPTMKAATVVNVYIGTAQLVVQSDDDGDRWVNQPMGGWIIDPEGVVKIAGTIGDQVPA